jgi:hypothetical protein
MKPIVIIMHRMASSFVMIKKHRQMYLCIIRSKYETHSAGNRSHRHWLQAEEYVALPQR